MSKRQKDPDTFNSVFPIVSIRRYQRGILVKRKSLLQSQMIRGDRSKIVRLSPSSLSRLAFIAMNTTTEFSSLITLTYGLQYPMSGKEIKRHLNRMLQALTRKFGKFEYLWFLEFQARGAPHFHILTTMSNVSQKRREIMAELWARVQELEDWQYSRLSDGKLFHVKQSVLRVHSHKTAWDLARKENGLKRYAVKYAMKTEQKEVPTEYGDVGRFWGCSRKVIPKEIGQCDVCEEDLREFLGRKGLKVAHTAILPKNIILW